MNKSAYIEVGGACFARCISCNVRNQPHGKMDFPTFCYYVDQLRDAGFTKIRLTGKEPLTNPDITDMISYLHLLHLDCDITTTLLTTDMDLVCEVAYISKLRVSLHAVGDQYETFMGVNKFKILRSNLQRLIQYRPNFEIYYTLIDQKGLCNFSLKHADSLCKFIDSLKGFEGLITFFPMHDYIEHRDEFVQNQMEGFVKHVVSTVPSARYIPFETRPQDVCTVHRERLYVKYDGSVYPCCMAGGEVGNNLESEVYLGNLNTDKVKKIQSKKLKGLSNLTCGKCTPKYYKLMKE